MLKIPIFCNSIPGINYIDDKKLPLFLELIGSSKKATIPYHNLSNYKGIYLEPETQAVSAYSMPADSHNKFQRLFQNGDTPPVLQDTSNRVNS